MENWYLESSTYLGKTNQGGCFGNGGMGDNPLPSEERLDMTHYPKEFTEIIGQWKKGKPKGIGAS